MRAIMMGCNIDGYLSKKTYLSKYIGMIAMLSSGMSVGKEGPYVHLAGCIANNLPYQELKENKSVYHEFLAAAVAIGVTCTMGAPFGGVIFAIEVSANTFTVSNLFKSFLVASITSCFFHNIHGQTQESIFNLKFTYFY